MQSIECNMSQNRIYQMLLSKCRTGLGCLLHRLEEFFVLLSTECYSKTGNSVWRVSETICRFVCCTV